jgi:CDP-glucose 4,6-dehydratase
LTGHTGFKGAWMSLILARLGALVTGFSLPPLHEAGVFSVTGVEKDVDHRIGDIRDREALADALREAEPEVVIHMAAQALVRPSYDDPVTTYATNVMGTIHLLEAVRRTPSVKAVVVVTSDKCYENKEWVWGYRESEPMGGHDPYSNSKGCAELVTASYRSSFLSTGHCRVATARAGNVIGGGDWSLDRLVPDAMRAFIGAATLRVRNPVAVRPWQHVLEPVIGYLILAQKLLGEKGTAFAEGWNFGPLADSEVEVGRVVQGLAGLWGAGAHWAFDPGPHPHEATYLALDCAKARNRLGWVPVTNLDDALRLTVTWYRAYADGADMRDATLGQIDTFLSAQMA